jgi:DNA-directed RNA polymerase subunit RPC12/RpoP
MMEFRCFHCGRLVRAEESAGHQQVPCPTCGHPVPVGGRRPDNHWHAGPRVHNGTPTAAEDWASKSNEEIAEQLLARARNPENSNAWALKTLLSPLLPDCDDLTLFAVSLAFLLLVLIDATVRQDLPVVFHALGGYGAPLLSLFLVFGMACSFVSIFLKRKKPEFMRWAMPVFAMYVTAGTGLYAGWVMLGRSPVWLMVFPAWNILNGLALLVLLRVCVFDTECIVDEKATFGQIIIASLAVVVLLMVCRCLFRLHWAATCSIAVAYTMNLHNILRHRMTRPSSRATHDRGNRG